MGESLAVVGIDASYTGKGPVAQMLDDALEACKQTGELGEGVEVSLEVFRLIDHMPGFTCPEQGVVPAYLRDIAQKLLAADIILIAVPTFWSWPSAMLVQFMIDITAFEVDGDFPLRGKVAAVISHCDEDGAEKVVSDTMVPLRHLGFAFAPFAGFWRNRTGARFSEHGWQEHDHTHVLAPNAVRFALALKKAGLQVRAHANDAEQEEDNAHLFDSGGKIASI